MSINTLEFSILVPAFIAGLLVTATHVPLGMQVLARGIVFIDLAIAQIAGCGVLIADRVGFEAERSAGEVRGVEGLVDEARLEVESAGIDRHFGLVLFS